MVCSLSCGKWPQADEGESDIIHKSIFTRRHDVTDKDRSAMDKVFSALILRSLHRFYLLRNAFRFWQLPMLGCRIAAPMYILTFFIDY